MSMQLAEKAVWSRAMIDSLPNSAFLMVEPGEDDDQGKRVPRTKRHFPYKNAEGSIDVPHLRNAIARIPQSDVPNKDALQARAQRMLAAETGSGAGKTIDEAPEWQQGAPLTIWHVGYQLQDLAEAVAERHKAMTFLGDDTKLGQRMQGPMRAKLREAMATLKNVLDWADMAEAGTEEAAKLAGFDADIALLELALAAAS